MYLADITRLTTSSIRSQRMRSLLTALGIAVGITAVVLLTSIGEGLHQYVLDEFSQFGANTISIQPGHTTTHGGSVGVIGTTRPLTLDDAQALTRISNAVAVNSSVQGNAEIESNGRRRRTTVYGVSETFPLVFRAKTTVGQFLPADDPSSPRAFVVLGSKVRAELFDQASPLGQHIRIGGQRYTVIGAFEAKGQILGIDLDDAVYVPTARALELFNRDGIMEINVLYEEGTSSKEVAKTVERILTARHGNLDFTVTTQEQMLEVLSSVLNALTFAVGAIGSISLFVGGIGILTIMMIAVTERTNEIGLLLALGATRRQIVVLFLGEAAILAAIGGVAGLIFGAGGAHLLGLIVPAIPVSTPLFYVVLAESLAISIGLIAGVLPARRAAKLDPIEALRAE